MRITYDTAKNQRNIQERQLSFDDAANLDWATARIWQDTRKAYPEVRYIAVGYLQARLHVVCFAEAEEGIRVISFRKANQREQRAYETTDR